MNEAYQITGVRHEGQSLVLDLVIDTDPILRAMQALAEAIEDSCVALERFAWAMSGTANTERVVCGQAARLYVRAGLDWGYSSPKAIGALTRSIMDGSESAVVSMMSVKNRARVAAAALRGYVEHMPGERPLALAWHRAFGPSVVVLGVAR